MPLSCTGSKGACFFLLCYALCIERRINGVSFTKGIQELFSPCIRDTNYSSKRWAMLLSVASCFLREGKQCIILRTLFLCGISRGKAAALHIHAELNKLWQSRALSLPHFMFPYPIKRINNRKAPRSC